MKHAYNIGTIMFILQIRNGSESCVHNVPELSCQQMAETEFTLTLSKSKSHATM